MAKFASTGNIDCVNCNERRSLFSMDLDSLRLFLHLSRSLHFGRTSKECHVSPSALSRTIQRLEEEAGAALLLRDRRSVALTEEGRLLQNFAHDTVTRFNSLHERLTRSHE